VKDVSIIGGRGENSPFTAKVVVSVFQITRPAPGIPKHLDVANMALARAVCLDLVVAIVPIAALLGQTGPCGTADPSCFFFAFAAASCLQGQLIFIVDP